MRQVARKPEETDARKKFSRFKKENAKPVRELRKAEETEKLREMKRLCKWLIECYMKPDDLKGEFSGPLEGKLSRIDYTAKDVEEFSIMMKELEGPNEIGEALAAFIESLIYVCDDDNFVIHTSHLSYDIAVGMAGMEGKTVTVIGDLDVAGESMHSGKLIVTGNVRVVSNGMLGGEIHIEGECKEIMEILGGKVYHKGKLIVDK